MGRGLDGPYGPFSFVLVACQVYPFLAQLEDFLWKSLEFRVMDLVGSKATLKRQLLNAGYCLDLQARITAKHGICPG
jgi:hypothetical protein